MCVYIQAITTRKNEAMNLKKNKRHFGEGLKAGK